LTPKSGGGWQETVLYRFNGRGVGDGEHPDASLLRDAKGHLHGTTPSGGGGTGCPFGCGVVFGLSPWPSSIMPTSSEYSYIGWPILCKRSSIAESIGRHARQCYIGVFDTFTLVEPQISTIRTNLERTREVEIGGMAGQRIFHVPDLVAAGFEPADVE
jgi:hypothetical protein